jgi:hypothetical protein
MPAAAIDEVHAAMPRWLRPGRGHRRVPAGPERLNRRPRALGVIWRDRAPTGQPPGASGPTTPELSQPCIGPLGPFQSPRTGLPGPVRWTRQVAAATGKH